ncbi:hypothetical protein QQP08_003635 [Theobroma cacao]|nr:hypothetical protein QQP08_003635 [Theobroma cacao]
MGYVIPRNEDDGAFTRDSVAESLRLVMVEEEGKIYRAKAKEMEEIFGDWEKQECYIDQLLSFLVTNKNLIKGSRMEE